MACHPARVHCWLKARFSRAFRSERPFIISMPPGPNKCEQHRSPYPRACPTTLGTTTPDPTRPHPRRVQEDTGNNSYTEYDNVPYMLYLCKIQIKRKPTCATHCQVLTQLRTPCMLCLACLEVCSARSDKPSVSNSNKRLLTEDPGMPENQARSPTDPTRANLCCLLLKSLGRVYYYFITDYYNMISLLNYRITNLIQVPHAPHAPWLG